MMPECIGMWIEDYMTHCNLLDDVDVSEVDQIIEEILSSNMQAVKEFQNGKEKALGSIVGQVMKRIKGDPKLINQQIRQHIALMET